MIVPAAGCWTVAVGALVGAGRGVQSETRATREEMFGGESGTSGDAVPNMEVPKIEQDASGTSGGPRGWRGDHGGWDGSPSSGPWSSSAGGAEVGVAIAGSWDDWASV